MPPNHAQKEGHLLGSSDIFSLETELHALKVCCDDLVVGSVLLELYKQGHFRHHFSCCGLYRYYARKSWRALIVFRQSIIRDNFRENNQQLTVFLYIN